jgi:hypothetical protein
MTAETETGVNRLMRLSKKFPALARAIIREPPVFEVDACKATPDDLPFATRVTDSPLQIEGRLTPDAVWRISGYVIPTAPEHDGSVEDDAAEDTLIWVDGVAEVMIRHAIPLVLANLAPSEARETFTRRLAQSRFAAAATIH